MEIYKVTEKDLIDDIKGFPIEVVQKMVDYQYAQTGKSDVSVFQIRADSGIPSGGFDWEYTKEDHDFWHDVIIGKVFDVFFARYPKQQDEDYWIKPEGVRMLVWDDSEKLAKERIVIAKLPKNTVRPYVCVNYDCEEYFENGEEYTTSRYKNAKPIPKIKEITMQEIADKFGLKVDEIKIKLGK